MDPNHADGADQGSQGDDQRSHEDKRSPSSSPSSWSLVLFGSAEFPVGNKMGQVRLNNLEQLNSCANREIFADLLCYKSILTRSRKLSVTEFEEAIADKTVGIYTGI